MVARFTHLGFLPFLTVASMALAPAPATAQAELFKLTASDGAPGKQFGASVAISGDRAIVGSIADLGYTGSAFLYDLATGQELAKLLASDGAPGDQLGRAVAIDGNLAVAGAFANSDNGLNSGSAYCFDVATGQQLHKLLPTDNAAGDYFGVSVAISGDLAVVGAPGDTPNGIWSGSAYVFNAATGAELWKLVPSDGQQDNNFGCDVGISGDRIVVGAFYDDDLGWLSGSAYVFDAATGLEVVKLRAADGAAGDYFGYSVAVDGDVALVGAYNHDNHGADSGAAYMFDVTTGQQIRKLVPSTGGPQDNFGFDVSISAERAVVGVTNDSYVNGQAGSAVVFDAATGAELFWLFASDGGFWDHLGWSVGVDGQYSVVGTPFHLNSRGAAYVFETLGPGTGYCFGDPGSGTFCPCGNNNDGTVSGSGCGNGVFYSGAQLTGTGIASVTHDSLVLTTTGLEPNNTGLYFQANNAVNGGDGNHFGDGLRCAGGGLIRLQVRFADSAGTSSTALSLAAKGGVAAGDTKRYQCWYRNTVNPPCGTGVNDFNLSNGFAVTWRP